MRATRVLLARAARPAHNAELQEQLSSKQYSSRVHIINRSLCDESLEFLRRSLPEKHTCDVIDIHPGVGIWSQALHKAIRPRRHVLVEPNKDVYEKWLDPLLNQPGSAYRHSPDLLGALKIENGLLSPEVLEIGNKINDPSSKGDHLKNSTSMLLITANLATTFRKVAGYSGTEAKRFFNLYYRSLFRGNEQMHRYGFVRMLAWIDEGTKRVLMPTTVVGQCKQSIQLDAACSMEMVVGPSQYGGRIHHLRRFYDVDAENFRDVVNKARKQGFEYSPERLPKEPYPPLAFFEPSVDFVTQNRQTFPDAKLFIEQVLAMRKVLTQATPGWLPKYEELTKLRKAKGFRQGRIGKLEGGTPDQIAYRKLVNQLNTHHNEWNKVTKIVHEHRALWKKFAAAYKKGDSLEPGSSDKADSLLAESADLTARTKKLKLDSRTRVDKAIDDYRAYDSEPQVMSWNRRTFEPLLALPGDCYPTRKNLSLLDIRPRPEHVEQLDTLDKQICFYYVATNMTIHLGDTVVQAIKRLVTAGHEEFLKTIPGLHDVTRGGWHDLSDLRIRSLHYDHWMKIALAFEKWPHRPNARQLLTFSSALYDDPL